MTAPDTTTAPTLRIASYNMRKAKGTDRQRDPDRIMRIIRDLDAEIVVLQEADMRLGERPSALPMDMLTAETGLIAVPVPSKVSMGWHGNAILLTPRAEVQDVQHINLPGAEPRGAMVVDTDIGGVALRVIATHLGLMRRSRRAQLSALIAHLDARSRRPTLIAGDMNEWSQTVGLGRLAHHFNIHAPGKSFHARMPMAALDRIAMDDDLRLVGGGVVETPDAKRASDHLPIWLDFMPLMGFGRDLL
jgi:endonuclease/exonuclease/phosphatase family metal-dependent hydrolase